MGLLVAIIIGGIIGYVAAKLLGRDEGVFASIIIGIIGSFIGGLISRLFTGADQGLFDASWSGVFWAFIGSVVLVAIMNAISRPRHHTVQ